MAAAPDPLPLLIGLESKRLFEPTRELGAGTAARVLADGRGNAFKLFHEPPDDTAVWRLKALRAARDRLPLWACPEEPVADYFAPDRVLGVRLREVPGPTLRDLLDRQMADLVAGRADALPPPAAKVRLLMSMAEGLGQARALRAPALLPDDWNPNQLVVAPDLSRADNVDADGHHLADYRTFPTGDATSDPKGNPGTPGYRSPERLADPRRLAGWEDIDWAYGVVAFELVYGFHPYKPRQCPAAGRLSPDERVRRGLCVKYLPPDPVFRPPPYAPVAVPDQVEALLRAALGPAHLRPAVADWVPRLTAWLNELDPPPADPRPSADAARRARRMRRYRRLRQTLRDLRLIAEAGSRPLCVLAVVAAAVTLGQWIAREADRPASHGREAFAPLAELPPPPTAKPPLPESSFQPPEVEALYREDRDRQADRAPNPAVHRGRVGRR
ncbi:MAG: serine/threonine-protein kinase [Gemmataceae bacterium]|nr:serine/threonine-protein kinase [Gemmataceae bacterium]